MGFASVVVSRAGVPSPPETVQLLQAAPAIFTTQSGVGQAIAVSQDGTLTDWGHPAAPGDVLTVYATGLGPVTPAAADGPTVPTHSASP